MDHSPAAPDYDADETLIVSGTEQLRALADDVRARIVSLLRLRALSATELGELMGMPKGTVGHHLKVLEKAGLVRVVRTRKVRAITERIYGRTARLFLIKSEDELVHGVAAASFGVVGQELGASPRIAMNGHVRVRLDRKAVARFNRRLDKLIDDLRAGETAEGETWAVAAAMYRVAER